jgi:hypothetical protein
LIQPLTGGYQLSDGHAINKTHLTQVKDHMPGTMSRFRMFYRGKEMFHDMKIKSPRKFKHNRALFNLR